MSHGINYLHSHSDIERKNNIPKDVVLVDEKYKELFESSFVTPKPFKYERTLYYKVPILLFVRKGGVFKNL